MQSISRNNENRRAVAGEEPLEGLHFVRLTATASGATGQRAAGESASATVRVDAAHLSRGLKSTPRGSTERSSKHEPLIVIIALIIALAAFVARCVAEESKLSEGAAAASSYQIGGHDDCLRRHAAPSNTPAYGGYYVGGGAAHHGEERSADEGTWGWDYFGRYFDRHIDLGWWHGTHYQGGIGAYKTDGPKLHHE